MSSVHFSGPRMGMSQMNGGSNRRPMNFNRSQSTENKPNGPSSQHDDLIKYIHDSWSKVESGAGISVFYHQDQESHLLKDFQPFDLQAYWGRRLVQSVQQTQHS